MLNIIRVIINIGDDMKKYLLVLLILIIPFMVNAATCDTDKITINSIKLVDDGNDNVTENSDPVAAGKEIKVDISMSNVGDNAIYKLIVKNDSDEDFEFDKNSINIDSQYIDYSFDIDGTNIIKANSSKEIYLNINYKKEVPDSAFEDGIFLNEQTMNVDLSNNSDVPNNPKTGISILLIFLLIVTIFSFLVLAISNNKKYNKLMVLLVALMLVIPVSVYALCRCSLKVDSRVRIESKVQSFCIRYGADLVNSEALYFRYEKGMTWDEYINSDYNEGNRISYLIRDPERVSISPGNYCHYVFILNGEEASIYDKIVSKHEGCYFESSLPC